MRSSPELVAHFKSTGEAWQSRMDDALRDYVRNTARLGLQANRLFAGNPWINHMMLY